jgi:hypothetical protein
VAVDYGTTANVGGYFDNMQTRFRLDHPEIRVRPVPRNIAAFIDDLSNDFNVTKPVGDLYIGTHANSDGFLLIPMFRGAVDAVGDATDVTDYEVLDQALGPSRPGKIPDSMVGYQRATPPAQDPAPTHSVHIKGCNIGRDRFSPKPNQPIAPFLTKLKQVFGNNVNVTAPKHFHGLLPETSHNGMFEYMSQELIVRTKAVPTKKGFRGFASRNEILAAYKAAHYHYHDGTAIPDGDWDAILVPKDGQDDRNIAQTIPLGKTVESLPAITVPKQFRIEIEEVDWTLPMSSSMPSSDAGRLAKLTASIAADPRFDANHAWPMYERRGFVDFNSYMAGHDWRFKISADKTVLECTGRRFDYTVVLPIVDRTVTPVEKRPIIFNYYPGPGSTESPILTGLVESNNVFFGRA